MKPSLLILFLSFLLFFSSLVGGYFIYEDLRQEKKIQTAKSDLKRLARASQLVGQRIPGIEQKNFWEKIGKAEPMLDPWGRPYIERNLEKAGTIVSAWASTGPNGLVGDADDLVEPYFKTETFNFTAPELDTPTKTTTVN